MEWDMELEVAEEIQERLKATIAEERKRRIYPRMGLEAVIVPAGDPFPPERRNDTFTGDTFPQK